MRNLHCCKDTRQQLPLPVELGDVTHFAVDSDGGVLYVAGSGLGVAAYRAADCEMLWCADLRASLEAAGSAAPPSGAAVAACDWVPELDALCLALSSGELLLLDAAQQAVVARSGAGAAAVEEVGAVDGGLAAAAWSPDGELLVLVTGTAQLLLMNKNWELLAEVPLLQQKEGPAETAADPAPEQPPHLALGSVSITWRGDGRYFATASLDAAGAPTATLRIWERDTAELHSHGQPESAAAALLPAAAWQPNGRHLYVAAARRQEGGEAAAAPYAVLTSDEAEQARQAAAEGIAHVGAWKRELRRRQLARAAASGAVEPEASVLLFECNGLQHGSFELPPAELDGCAIEQLDWSPNSEFLAVVLSEADEDGLPQQVLQLWHRSNWHWYCKAERRSRCCAALHAAWDAAAAGSDLLLHLVTAEGDYQQLQFSRQPTVSAGGTAVVVDGASLLITPLRHTVVPPPMCAVTAALPASVNCLAVRDFGDCEAIAAVLSDGSLALLSSVEDDLWEDTLEEQLEAQPWDRPCQPRLLPQRLALESPTLEAAAATGASAVQLATWVAEDRLLLVAGIDNSSSELLVELAVDAAAGTAREVAAIDSGVPPLLACCSRPGPGGGALLQQHSGALLLYTPGGTLRTLPAAACFPCGCQQMAATPPAVAEQAGSSTPAAFGLSARGQLYWGGRQLAADVTSFAVRRSGPGGAFLLFTTRQHQLHTVSLASLVDGSAAGLLVGGGAAAAGQPAAQQPPAAANATQGFRAAMKAAMRPAGAAGAGAAGGVNVRSIEQNALLVAVPPDDVQAILQMPRGNLEAIKPRSLVLPAVAAALDVGDYAEAWDLATVNRLDLNVLADYRWPRFLGQADAFVAQVPGDQDIADLLSALDEGSTAAPGGLYAAALPAAPASGTAAGGAEQADIEPDSAAAGAAAAEEPSSSKVAAVCAAVRAALERRDKARYLRAILTSHAKCGQLEAALALVQAAKEEELAGRQPEGAPTAEDGLKHLLLFISDDTLYRAALGMYELELAYMVVAHAQQKDPGEYLLELQRFAEVADPHLRRHAIDMHLRRWESALRNLLAAGDEHFGAALELARDKGLLRQLLQLQQGKPERLAEAYAAYGDVLESKGLHEDAGLAYVAAGQTDRAISAYRSAGQWRMAFALAAKAGWPAEQQQRMAAGLAEDLAAMGRAADAAALTLQCLQDVDSAVLLLTQGKEWREALRVAYSHSRPDLVDTLVAPQAAQAAAAALEDINENIERVAKYGQRLAQLRERRAAMEAALEAAAVESGLPSRQQPEDLFDDTESVADSMISGLSIYTDHTHTGATSVASSSISASTVGGKKRAKKPGKGKSKSGRIRQGSPQEEQQLAEHLLGLAPHSALCAEVGQLAELLVLLGHPSDAALLQQRLALLVQQQAAAAADVLAHPPPALALALPLPQARALASSAGPAAAAAVASTLAGMPSVALQQRVAASEAAVREAHWKWDILRDAEGGSGAVKAAK